jgi:HK97 family phage major capsid protein
VASPDDINPETILKEIKRIGDELKPIGEKALAEAKKAGDMTLETKTKVDELLIKQGELQARLQEAEQKLDRRGGDKDAVEQKSVGQRFIESDAWKDFKEKNVDIRERGVNFGVKAITSDPASAGDGIAPDRLTTIVGIPDRRMTVRDLITPGRTGSAAIQYLQETGFTNNAAIAAEGTKKGESSLTFDLKNQAVVTVAHFIKASKQILDDFAQLQSYIDGRLRYGLMLVEDAQLLKGSGVGNNLNGIYTQATAYVAPLAIPGATRIDVLRLALLQAELAEYPSTGIVLHPTDWAAIELTKDDNGAYIFANPQSLAQPGLWGRPVVTTQAMTLDSFLVGAFKLGAQVFDREEANVVIATQNEDDFVKNLITIRGEERLALAVYRPEAFVKGDITPAA